MPSSSALISFFKHANFGGNSKRQTKSIRFHPNKRNNRTRTEQDVMHSESDSKFFELCFELVEQAYASQEVPVGCVFVFNGQIIGKGFNEVNKTRNPTRHAEFVAIEEADKWCKQNEEYFAEVMKRTTVYVNLEPCIMCASALYQLKIFRLVFGAKNPRFGGISSVASNAEYGHPHEIQITGEIEKEKCIVLLRRFYDRENPFAPEEKRKIKNSG